MPAARGMMTKRMIVRRHPAVLKREFPAVSRPDRIDPAAHILALENAPLVPDNRRKHEPRRKTLVGAKIAEPRFGQTRQLPLPLFQYPRRLKKIHLNALATATPQAAGAADNLVLYLMSRF